MSASYIYSQWIFSLSELGDFKYTLDIFQHLSNLADPAYQLVCMYYDNRSEYKQIE